MINNVVLVGRLTKDPDLRYTASGTAVATFTLAVNRNFTNQSGNREADFINCVIWRKSAETLANFCLYTDIDIVWLLTGKEACKVDRLAILRDLEEWVSQEMKVDPRRKEWFEIQLLDSFQPFKKWMEAKNEVLEKAPEMLKQSNGSSWK